MEQNAAGEACRPLATAELSHRDQAGQATNRHHQDSDDGDNDDPRADADIDASGTDVLADLRNSDHDVQPGTDDNGSTNHHDDGSTNHHDDGSTNHHDDGSRAHSQHCVPDRYA